MNSTIKICDIIPACCPLMNNGCCGCDYFVSIYDDSHVECSYEENYDKDKIETKEKEV